ncbi:MAG: hypothetical protein LQ340_000687 [Diploschistes diacapsis]|nr:MAG: hypothetical protein LQ340_000687 [Diploschistes diacapsis]
MNDLNYDFKDAQFDQLLSRRMTEDNPGDRPCSLSILEEAGMQLDKLGYQAGALKFLHSSATEGRLLFRAIIKSLDRIAFRKLIHDGESSEPLTVKGNRVWNSVIATFILGYHQRAKNLILETEDDSSKEIVQACIKLGMDLISNDADSSTPLHWAVSANQVAICEVLLSDEILTTTKNDQGYTSIHIAADMDHKAIVQLLINPRFGAISATARMLHLYNGLQRTIVKTSFYYYLQVERTARRLIRKALRQSNTREQTDIKHWRPGLLSKRRHPGKASPGETGRALGRFANTR